MSLFTAQAGAPLTDLLSRHAIALVVAVFLLLLATAIAVLLIGGMVWRRRAAVWSLIGRGVRWVGKLRLVAATRERFPGVFGLVGRLSPTRFLEVYLLGGLLVSLGMLLFAALAEDVARKSSLVGFDQNLAAALQNTWTPRAVLAISRVTALGGGPALTAIGIGVALLLILRRERSLLIGWVVATLGASVLTTGLKGIFQRARPEYAGISGWSFPSGHSMGSFIAYGMLAYIIAHYVPRWPARIIGAAALLLVLFIGFSRLYLGVHYFSDVIAGYSVGVVWLAVCISGTEIARMREKHAAPFENKAASS